jgi:exopolysaccharide/PEP-CTERM locus tyrosine autokinase
MSLVEQAMTRLRRPGESAGAGAATQPIATPLTERATEPARAAKQMIVDINLLRARGYLPEEDKDRQFADEYRKIKRPLIRKALAGAASAGAADPRLIMVTSALPGDGKTFTSINLAFSLARERDISVVLVDADLLKPHVSRIFGVQQERGLTDALVDESLSIESLVIQSNVRGFSILPAGATEEGTSELLSSDRMRQVVKSLCANNPRRMVLLDSPPLLITTEGPALVSASGQVVLVIRAGLTPRRAVLDAIGMIDAERAGGIVLNEAQMGVMHGYYGYGYGNYGDAGAPKP